MSTTDAASNKLVDIILPAAPAATGDTYIIVLFACLLLVVLVALVSWYQHHTRGKYRRRLAQLSRSLDSSPVNTRKLAYQVAQILTDGLDIHSISSATQLPNALQQEQGAWQNFTSRLDMYRYASIQPEQYEVMVLISESSYWLRNWR